MVYFFLAVLLCFHALSAQGVSSGTVRLSGQLRGFPIPLFLWSFRKFYSTIFSALRRMAALDSSERYTVSTNPPSAST